MKNKINGVARQAKAGVVRISFVAVLACGMLGAVEAALGGINNYNNSCPPSTEDAPYCQTEGSTCNWWSGDNTYKGSCVNGDAGCYCN